MSEHKNKKKFEKKEQTFRVPWDRLSQEEKDEIVEKARLRKEEEQRKLNRKTADIMMGKQKTQDNCWE